MELPIKTLPSIANSCARLSTAPVSRIPNYFGKNRFYIVLYHIFSIEIPIDTGTPLIFYTPVVLADRNAVAHLRGHRTCHPKAGYTIYIYNIYIYIYTYNMYIFIYVYLFLSRNNMKPYSRYSYIIRCFDCVYLCVCAHIHAYDTVCM